VTNRSSDIFFLGKAFTNYCSIATVRLSYAIKLLTQVAWHAENCIYLEKSDFFFERRAMITNSRSRQLLCLRQMYEHIVPPFYTGCKLLLHYMFKSVVCRTHVFRWIFFVSRHSNPSPNSGSSPSWTMLSEGYWPTSITPPPFGVVARRFQKERLCIKWKNSTMPKFSDLMQKHTLCWTTWCHCL